MAEKKGLHEDVYLESGSSGRGQRTWCEKVLAIVVLLFFCVIVVLAVALILQMKVKEEEEICLTKECAEVASRIVTSIDYSVNPCDNFYDFACGQWMKTHVVPNDRSNLYTYGVVRENVKITMKYLLEGNNDDDVEAVQKARHFYQSCMNESHIENLGTSRLVEELERLGGWPILGTQPGGNWNRSRYDMLSDLSKLNVIAISPLITVYVGNDERDNGKRIIMVGEPRLGMPNKDYFFEAAHERVRRAFIKYITNIAVLLGADLETAKADVKAIFEFEKLMANLTLSKTERRSGENAYNKMTIEELEQQYPAPSQGHAKFSWHEYIQRTMRIADENITIEVTEPIILESPVYYKHIFDVVQKQDERTIKNFLMWSLVAKFVDKLPKRFMDELTKYRKIQYGTTVKTSRWKICSDHIMHKFGLSIGRLFVKESFDQESKTKALEMVHDLREAFFERLDELSWMDTGTKNVAIDKAKHIKELIGFDNFILNNSALNEYYSEIEVIKDEFLGNTIRILKVWSRNSLKSLREPYKKEDQRWDTSPAVVNAYYVPQLNLISFPAGMLQPPYYSKYQPRSMNYGSIGFLIGHEITHAFDDQGRKYDKDGNKLQWWSNDAIERFQNKTKCFVDQYNQYVMPQANIHLNGEFTQGENIADNGGVQQSYKAYQTWRKRSKSEPLLPGVNFTHNQLFFINFAQSWCGVATKEFEVDMVHTDVHSPGRFRIIGSLQNMEEFSQVFNCPSGSYMNPKNKCHVW